MMIAHITSLLPFIFTSQGDYDNKLLTDLSDSLEFTCFSATSL